jgi:hypothetical protein
MVYLTVCVPKGPLLSPRNIDLFICLFQISTYNILRMSVVCNL